MSLEGFASNAKEAIEQVRAMRPDVTLMHLKLPHLSGIDATIAVRTEFPDARIIILTTFERDVEIPRALKAGAHAFLLKSMPPKQMLETIRQVHHGKKVLPPEIAAGLAEHLGDESLSQREVDVLRHVAEGKRNQDIAESSSSQKRPSRFISSTSWGSWAQMIVRSR